MENVRLLCLALLLLAAGCAKAPCEGDNIILVVVDTLRADHATPYGYGQGTTPRLKRFASQGIVFEDASAQASFTMASMGTMLTSTYPFQHGAARHPSLLEGRNITLAEVLKAKGYRTAAWVSNPLLAADSGFDQGFDDYFPLQEKETQGAEGLVRRALDWIGEEEDEPFFLWLHLIDPHFPYNAKPGFILDRDEEGRQEYEALLQERRSGKRTAGQIFFQPDLSEKALAEAVKAYDSEVAYCDYHFGVLLDELERLGLSDRTVVIFTSDHGESLGEHGLFFCHGFSVYEEALRVPWVMRLPKDAARPGLRIKDPVRLLDLMPTLLGLVGVDPPAGMRGKDLCPLILEEGTLRDPLPVFAESEPLYLDQGERRYPERKMIFLPGDEGKWRSVREGDCKLIRIPGANEQELNLFDLERDPKESDNLSGRAPETLVRLLGALRAWLDDPERRPSVVVPEKDTEWARRLQSLGYGR